MSDEPATTEASPCTRCGSASCLDDCDPVCVDCTCAAAVVQPDPD